ncbi:hypothetical protein TrLO_g10647 [Triparma laevis f. longispina]|uniref:Uncharacterized protein n=1 Tax=Triparma laevis f. longispina TaxID=1714387 RepID=A0A9W7AFL7_9STRA|nr:hypothetical protein TrLO_g10647 [Triparma laevis f. longispina]
MSSSLLLLRTHLLSLTLQPPTFFWSYYSKQIEHLGDVTREVLSDFLPIVVTIENITTETPEQSTPIINYITYTLLNTLTSESFSLYGLRSTVELYEPQYDLTELDAGLRIVSTLIRSYINTVQTTITYKEEDEPVRELSPPQSSPPQPLPYDLETFIQNSTDNIIKTADGTAEFMLKTALKPRYIDEENVSPGLQALTLETLGNSVAELRGKSRSLKETEDDLNYLKNILIDNKKEFEECKQDLLRERKELEVLKSDKLHLEHNLNVKSSDLEKAEESNITLQSYVEGLNVRLGKEKGELANLNGDHVELVSKYEHLEVTSKKRISELIEEVERIKGETEVKGDRELEGIKGMYRREVLELKGEIEKERKSRIEWEDKGVISVRSSSEHQRLKVLSDQELERVNNVNSELREELKSNKSRIGEFEIIVSRITSECDDHKIKAEKEFELRVGLEKRLESLTLEYNTLNSSSNESNILLATLKSKSNNSELLNKDFTIKLEKIEEEMRRVRKEGDEWGREKVRVERVNVGLSEDLKNSHASLERLKNVDSDLQFQSRSKVKLAELLEDSKSSLKTSEGLNESLNMKLKKFEDEKKGSEDLISNGIDELKVVKRELETSQKSEENFKRLLSNSLKNEEIKSTKLEEREEEVKRLKERVQEVERNFKGKDGELEEMVRVNNRYMGSIKSLSSEKDELTEIVTSQLSSLKSLRIEKDEFEESDLKSSRIIKDLECELEILKTIKSQIRTVESEKDTIESELNIKVKKINSEVITFSTLVEELKEDLKEKVGVISSLNDVVRKGEVEMREGRRREEKGREVGDNLKEKVISKENEIDRLSTSHSFTLENLKSNHSSEMIEIEKSHLQEIKRLEDEKERELNRKNQISEGEKKRLEEEIRRVSAGAEDFESSLKSTIDTLNEQVSILNISNLSLEDSLSNEKSKRKEERRKSNESLLDFESGFEKKEREYESVIRELEVEKENFKSKYRDTSNENSRLKKNSEKFYKEVEGLKGEVKRVEEEGRRERVEGEEMRKKEKEEREEEREGIFSNITQLQTDNANLITSNHFLQTSNSTLISRVKKNASTIIILSWKTARALYKLENTLKENQRLTTAMELQPETEGDLESLKRDNRVLKQRLMVAEDRVENKDVTFTGKLMQQENSKLLEEIEGLKKELDEVENRVVRGWSDRVTQLESSVSTSKSNAKNLQDEKERIKEDKERAEKQFQDASKEKKKRDSEFKKMEKDKMEEIQEMKLEVKRIEEALSSEKAKLENQLRVKNRDCTILNSEINALKLEGKGMERKGEEKVKETERIIEGLRDSIRLKESDLQEKSKDTERIISGLKSDLRLKEKDLEEKSRDLERVVEGLREEGREGERRIEELKEKVNSLSKSADSNSRDSSRTIETLRMEVNSLEKSADSKNRDSERKIETLNSKISTLEKSASSNTRDSSRTIETLNFKIESLEKSASTSTSTAERSIETLNAKILDLEKSSDANTRESKRSSDALIEEVKALEKSADSNNRDSERTIEAMREEASTAASTTSLTIESLNAKIKSLEKSATSNTRDSARTIETLNAKIKSLEKSASTAASAASRTIETLENEISSLKNETSSLKNETSSLNSKIAALTKSASTAASTASHTIEALKLEVKSTINESGELEDEVDRLKRSLLTLSSTNSDLSSTIESTTSVTTTTIKDLKKNNAALDQDIKYLKKEIRDILESSKSDVERFETYLHQKEQSISNLQASKTKSSNEIKLLEDKVREIQRKLVQAEEANESLERKSKDLELETKSSLSKALSENSQTTLKLTSLTRELSSRDNEKRSHLEKLNRVKEDNERMDRKIREVERDVDQSTHENQRLKDEMREKEREVEREMSENMRLKEEMREKEREVDQSISENQRLKDELRSKERDVDQSISENKRLKDELRSNQNRSTSASASTFTSNITNIDSRQISLLKSEIDALKQQQNQTQTQSTPIQQPRNPHPTPTTSRTPMSLAGARILKRIRTNTNTNKISSPPPPTKQPSPIPKTPYTPTPHHPSLSQSAIHFEDETSHNIFDYGNVYVEQLKHLQEELDKERLRSNQLDKKNKNLKNEDERLQKTLNSTQTSISTLTNTLNQSHVQISSLNSNLSEAKSRIFQLQTAISEKEAAIHLLDRAREETASKVARLIENNAELIVDKKELGERVDELRKKVREDSSRIEKMSDTDAKLERETKENVKIRDQLKTLEDEFEALKDAKCRFEKFSKDKTKCLEKITTLEQQLEAKETDFEKVRLKMKLERTETFIIMEEAEVKFEQSQRVVKSTERKLKLVEEDLAGYKSEAGELRAALETAREELRKMEVKRIMEEDELAKANLLMESLQSRSETVGSIDSDELDSLKKQNASLLKDLQDAKTTPIPVPTPTPTPTPPTTTNSNSTTERERELNDATMTNEMLEERIEELEDAVKEKQEELLQAKDDIKTMAGELSESVMEEAAVDRMKEIIEAEFEKEKSAIMVDLEAARRAAFGRNSELKDAKEKIEELEESVDTKDGEIVYLKSQFSKIEVAKQSLQATVEMGETGVSELHSELEIVRCVVDRLEEEKKSLHLNNSSLNATLTSLQQSLSEEKEKFDLARSELLGVEEVRATIEKDFYGLKNEKMKLEQQIQQHEADKSKLKATVALLEAAASENEEGWIQERRSLEIELETSTHTLDQLRQKNSSLESDVLSERELNGALEEKMDSLNDEKRKSHESVQSSERALADADKTAELESARADALEIEVAKLKKSLESESLKEEQINRLESELGRVKEFIAKKMKDSEEEKRSSIAKKEEASKSAEFEANRADGLATEVVRLKNIAKKADEWMASANTNLARLDAEKSTSAAEVVKLTAEIQSLSAEIQSLKTEAATNMSWVETLKKEKEELENVRNTLSSSSTSTTETLNSEIAILKTNSANAEKFLAEANAALTELQTNRDAAVEKLTSEIDSLKKINAAETNKLATEIEQLKSNASAADTWMAAANENLAALESEKKELLKKLNESTSSSSTTSTEITRLQAEIQTLKTNGSKAEEWMNASADNIGELETEIQTLKENAVQSDAWMAQASAAMDDLEKEHDAAMCKVKETAEGALEGKQKRVAELEAELEKLKTFVKKKMQEAEELKRRSLDNESEADNTAELESQRADNLAKENEQLLKRLENLTNLVESGSVTGLESVSSHITTESSMARESPLFRKNEDSKTLVKALTQIPKSVTLDEDDAVDSVNPAANLFDAEREQQHLEQEEMVEELTSTVESLMADREDMLAETVGLLEACKAECAIASEAESARVRQEALSLILKVKGKWIQDGKNNLMNFAVAVGVRVEVMRAFMKWRVNIERQRRVTIGKKFVMSMNDAKGELGLLAARSPVVSKPARNPFEALVDEEARGGEDGAEAPPPLSIDGLVGAGVGAPVSATV